MNDAYFSAFSLLQISDKQIWRRVRQRFSSCLSFSLLFYAFIFTTTLPLPVLASNYLYEFEFAETLKKQIPEQEFVWLKTDSPRDTLALFRESESGELRGTAIILSDLGKHPDWPNVIHDLRYALPAHDWSTLSVQMPVDVDINSNNDSNRAYQTIKKRLTAAIAHIENTNPGYVAIIARGKSANFAIRFVSESQNEATAAKALVFISAYDTPHLTSSDYMKNIAAPMLDIFAEKDQPNVLKSAKKRNIAARFAAKLRSSPQNLYSSRKVQELALNKSGNLRFRQIIIPGANGLFTAQKKQLVKAIRGWLQVHTTKKRTVASQ